MSANWDYKTRVELFNASVGQYVSDEVFGWLEKNGFFTQAASTKFHGSYDGGLFDHSFMVMLHLVNLTQDNNLVWQNERSPYIVGMFHDLCKIDQYRKTGEGYVFVRDTPLMGHGNKSVTLLSTIMDLTEEERLCIRFHMGAFAGKEEWPMYTDAIHKYKNVLWTHQADMMAAHIDCV